jgi:hypothetical protein
MVIMIRFTNYEGGTGRYLSESEENDAISML